MIRAVLTKGSKLSGVRNPSLNMQRSEHMRKPPFIYPDSVWIGPLADGHPGLVNDEYGREYVLKDPLEPLVTPPHILSANQKLKKIAEQAKCKRCYDGGVVYEQYEEPRKCDCPAGQKPDCARCDDSGLWSEPGPGEPILKCDCAAGQKQERQELLRQWMLTLSTVVYGSQTVSSVVDPDLDRKIRADHGGAGGGKHMSDDLPHLPDDFGIEIENPRTRKGLQIHIQNQTAAILRLKAASAGHRAEIDHLQNILKARNAEIESLKISLKNALRGNPALRRSMCQRKVSFTTRGAAQNRADKWGGRVYECPICACFHVTTKPPLEEDS